MPEFLETTFQLAADACYRGLIEGSHEMEHLIDFVIVLALAAGLGGALMMLLAVPMYRVLVELCGTRDRAGFWIIYLGIMLVLTPVLCVSALSAFWSRGMSSPELLEKAVFVAAVGIAFALILIGRGIWHWVRLVEPRDTANAKQAVPSRKRSEAVSWPESSSSGPRGSSALVSPSD